MSIQSDRSRHTPVAIPSASTLPATITIDMVDPARACTMLQLDHGELLALAIAGELAAYDLGGHIRFRYRDVASLASRRAIAA